MNGYTFECLPSAEADLADVWLHAADRAAVNRADRAIERLLTGDPLGVGEELSEGLRRLTVEPLIAYYWVDEVIGHVTVSNYAAVP